MRALDLVVRALGPRRKPFFLHANPILQRLLMARLCVKESFLRFQKLAVVALGAQHPRGIGPIQLRHLRRDVLKEVAIVADDDAGKGLAGQQFFQPFDPGQVEMVRRLVEQQQIGLLDEGFGDGQPFAPAAGECIRDGFKISEARHAESGAQTRLPIGLMHSGPLERAFDDLPDGSPGVQTGILLNVRHAQVPARSDLAGVGLDVAGEHLEQRGFAAAVRPDQSDAVAVVDGETRCRGKAWSRRRSWLRIAR